QVVVKFASTYCKQAHTVLAKAGYAPTLRYCQRRPDVGNLTVVIMDLSPGAQAEPSNITDKVITTLRDAIDKLHAEKLVFGDLRPPNIIVHNSSVHLVDFDWAGRVGEARYPSTIN
ncbi:hypothetical protein B0H11DRAFT_1613085, partial [Mycena galericulata]